MTMVQLSSGQLKRLSEHFSNLSLFFFATAIAPVFAPVEKRDPFMVISGLVLYLFCLIESLVLSKNAINSRS